MPGIIYLQALPLVYGAKVQGYTEAIALLDRALVLDPTYAPRTRSCLVGA